MSANPDQLINTTEEDAYAFLVRIIHDHLIAGQLAQLNKMNNGCDIHLPDVVSYFLPQVPGANHPNPISVIGKQKEAVYRAFYNAAWQMCLLGLLRPSAAYEPNGNRVPGDGYSITERGFQWFKEGDIDSLVLSTHKMGQLLNQHSAKFGDGYAERSEQAFLCHSGRAFLACCAMCGAAAESILLALAVTKEGNEATIMQKYKARDGRLAIEKTVFDGKKDNFKNKFKSGLDLLKYWRDESSHGAATAIDDIEATVALNQLLRLAQLCDEHWDELIS